MSANDIVSIELTTMGKKLITYLEDYHNKIEQETEEIVKKAIDNFDFEAYITPLVEDYIRRTIREKLSKTDLRDIINKKVDETLREFRGK